MSFCKTPCPLHDTTRHPCISGGGDPAKPIWVIGEGPGKYEEETGKLFVGYPGAMLESLLEEAGLTREDVYIDNVVKCRPPDSRDPKSKEADLCFEQNVGQLVKDRKPRVIVLAGRLALRAFGLMGNRRAGVGSWVGKVVKSVKWGCWLVPIYHPAMLSKEVFPDDPMEGETTHHADDVIEVLKKVKELATKELSFQVATQLCEALPRVATKLVSVDIETTGLDWRTNQIRGVAVSAAPRHASYLPWKFAQYDDEFRRLMADELVTKVFHNAKFDVKFLRRNGIDVKGMIHDTMVAAHLVDENFPLDLKSLAHRYTDWGGYEEGVDVLKADDAGIYQYSCTDAIVTRRLWEILAVDLYKQGLWKLYDELAQPLNGVLMQMEEAGIRVDVPYLLALKKEQEEQIASLEKKLKRLAKGDVNMKSPKQLAKLLYVDMGLPVLRISTKTKQPSTDVTALTMLAGRSAFCRSLLEYRKVTKLYSTYVVALLEQADSSGIIYTTLNQTGTCTGRISSSNPNLQNIPIRGEEGKKIRQAFIAREGCVLIDADFSQIELRIMAKFSRDPLFLKAYMTEGGDLHRATAAIVYGVPENEVTKEQRSNAKTINFGLIYGMGPGKLARATGMTYEQAQEFMAKYFEAIPKTVEAIEWFHQRAKKVGYVQTPFGRKRRLPEIRDGRDKLRARVERQSVNSPVQGGAGNCCNLALIRIARRLEQEERTARILLAVHDEIVIEVPELESVAVAKLVKEEMEAPMPGIDIPLKAEVEVVHRWKGPSEEPVVEEKSDSLKEAEVSIESVGGDDGEVL